MNEVVEKETASVVIAHPVRVQILTIANERDISPARYVEDVLGISSSDNFGDYSRALSHVAYHFRVLARVGCLEVVDEQQKRGSVEHIYRSVARAEFTDAEWAALSIEERCEVITVTWQGLMAKTEAARLASTLGSRDGTQLAWTAARLDDRGWSEMAATIAANYAELERIRRESEERLLESEGEPIQTTFAMMGFESPGEVFYDKLPSRRPRKSA